MFLAIPLAAIVEVMVAITAALLLYATWRYKDNLANAIRGAVPVIGGLVATGFETLTDLLIGSLAGWLSTLTGPMAAWISSLYYPTQTLTNASFHHAESLLQKFKDLRAGAWSLFLQSIAFAESKVEALANYTGYLIQQAEATAYANLLGLAAWTTVQLQALARYTGTLIQQAEATAYANLLALAAWTTGQLQSLARYTGTLIQQAEATAYANLLALAAWTTGQLQALIAYTEQLIADTRAQAAAEAQAAYAGAVSTVDQEAVGTVAGVWPGIAAPGQRVLDEVAAEYPGTIPRSVTVPQTIPADLAQVLAGVEALAIPATIALDECLLPMCRNMGNYSNWLKDLAGLLGGGIALEWLIWAIEHPHEAAADAATVATDLAAPVVDIVKTVA